MSIEQSPSDLAKQLRRQFGEQAVTVAAGHIVRSKTSGDELGLTVWQGVAEELLRFTPSADAMR